MTDTTDYEYAVMQTDANETAVAISQQLESRHTDLKVGLAALALVAANGLAMVDASQRKDAIAAFMMDVLNMIDAIQKRVDRGDPPDRSSGGSGGPSVNDPPAGNA